MPALPIYIGGAGEEHSLTEPTPGPQAIARRAPPEAPKPFPTPPPQRLCPKGSSPPAGGDSLSANRKEAANAHAKLSGNAKPSRQYSPRRHVVSVGDGAETVQHQRPADRTQPPVTQAAALEHPTKADAFGRSPSPGPGPQPWAFFAFFLSLQKEGPPEGQRR